MVAPFQPLALLPPTAGILAPSRSHLLPFLCLPLFRRNLQQWSAAGRCHLVARNDAPGALADAGCAARRVSIW